MNSCAACRHSEVMITDDGEGEDGVTLTCRRFPPQVMFDGEGLATYWPEVGASDSCGEWSWSGPDVLRRGMDRALQMLGLKS